MENENKYLTEFENYSDDEIFEIISNSDETDNLTRYTAAVSIALKRELISEYQSMELINGNTSVLEYNPNSVDKGAEDYYKEEEIRKEDSKKNKITKTHYGLILTGMGIFLLLIALSGELFFPTKTKIVGITSIVAGLFMVISSYVEKMKKQQ